MEQKEYEKLKEKFLKLVPSVPLNLRNEVIAVVDGKPVDWDVASEEVKRNTKASKLIVDQLKKVGLLKND